MRSAEIVGFGMRDIILPGEMKELLNKVIEAQKAAEASLITRREETAAIRSQANTATLLEGNPILMRLRELEVIERVAQSGKISVVVAEKGIGNGCSTWCSHLVAPRRRRGLRLHPDSSPQTRAARGSG